MSPRYSNVTSSIRGYDYTICITQSQIHLFNQHKVLQRVPQRFYWRVKAKTCANPMHKFTRSLNPQVDHQNIHQVDHVNIPLSPQISTARHTSSVFKSLKTQSNKITSKGKLNSLQEGRGGETPYDSTIVTKLVVHQDRAKSRTREREREMKHIATRTYPQPRG